VVGLRLALLRLCKQPRPLLQLADKNAHSRWLVAVRVEPAFGEPGTPLCKRALKFARGSVRKRA